jgi:flagellar biosynthesis protein FlhG
VFGTGGDHTLGGGRIGAEPGRTRRPGFGRTEGPQLIPVGGGKGGVGKTFVAANLAATLARGGYRVVAVDVDLEGANLHTALGVRRPRRSLADYVAEREEDIPKLLEDTSIENLQLVAATRPNLGSPQPGHARRIEFVRALRQLDADFVLLDLAAGTDRSVMDYFMVCDDGIVVLSPEPTSIENAYAFMRAAFYRRLRLAMLSDELRTLVGLAMDERNERGIRTPFDLLREVEQIDPAEGARFARVMRSFRPRVVVNGARSAEDIRLGFSVCSVCRRYFAIEADYMGYLNHTDDARRSLRALRPLVDAHPRSDAAVYFGRIARKLLEVRGSQTGGAA